MSTLLSRLQDDLNAARKARDASLVLVVGTILSDAKNRGLELGRDATDEEVVEVVRRGIKRRRESAEMYAKGGRTDLSEKESEEARILERYLPAAPDADEIRSAVRAAIDDGAANVGAVMAKVMPQFRGRAEGSQINAIAREELARGA